MASERTQRGGDRRGGRATERTEGVVKQMGDQLRSQAGQVGDRSLEFSGRETVHLSAPFVATPRSRHPARRAISRTDPTIPRDSLNQLTT